MKFRLLYYSQAWRSGRWRSNLSGKCSQERLTRGTVTITMRRAAHPSGCERCVAGAGCSAIKYQSIKSGDGPCSPPKTNPHIPHSTPYTLRPAPYIPHSTHLHDSTSWRVWPRAEPPTALHPPATRSELFAPFRKGGFPLNTKLSEFSIQGNFTRTSK